MLVLAFLKYSRCTEFPPRSTIVLVYDKSQFPMKRERKNYSVELPDFWRIKNTAGHILLYATILGDKVAK
jgi:hypothetical protein